VGILIFIIGLVIGLAAAPGDPEAPQDLGDVSNCD